MSNARNRGGSRARSGQFAMVIGKLERHDHPFPGVGTLLEERPGTFLRAATKPPKTGDQGYPGRPKSPPFTGNRQRLALGLHSCPPDRSPSNTPKEISFHLRSVGFGIALCANRLVELLFWRAIQILC